MFNWLSNRLTWSIQTVGYSRNASKTMILFSFGVFLFIFLLVLLCFHFILFSLVFFSFHGLQVFVSFRHISFSFRDLQFSKIWTPYNYCVKDILYIEGLYSYNALSNCFRTHICLWNLILQIFLWRKSIIYQVENHKTTEIKRSYHLWFFC